SGVTAVIHSLRTRRSSDLNEGAFVEIIKEVERRIQQPINVTITPFARVDRQLDSGEHDCTILVPLSEKQIIQGDIVSYHPIGFIDRKSTRLNSSHVKITYA